MTPRNRQSAPARRWVIAIWRASFALLIGGLVCTRAELGTAAQRTSAQPAAKSAAKPAAGKQNSQPAQSAKPAVAGSTDVSVEAISQRLAQLQAASDADVPDRKKLTALYQQALDQLKQADDYKSHGAEFDAQHIAVPYQLQSQKQEAAALAPPPRTLPTGAQLTDWEQQLSAAEEELETARKNLSAQEDEPARRASRRVEIPKAIAAARVQLDALDQSNGATDESAALVEARRVARAAQRRQLQEQIGSLEKELQTYDADSIELLKLQHETASRKAADLEQLVAAWRDAVNQRRGAEATRQATEAHWAAVTAVPAVRQLADENSQLADQRQQLADAMKSLDEESETVQQRLDKVSDEFKDIKEKVKVAGLTDAVGQMLRKQRGELVAIEADRHAIGLRQEEIARVQLSMFDLQEQLTDLRDVGPRARKMSGALPEGSTAKTDDLRTILKTRRQYLDDLLKDENTYFNALVDLDSKQQELLSKAAEYRSYIDERVLWVRSTHPLALADLPRAGEAVVWIVQPKQWWASLSDLADTVRVNFGVVALAMFLFGLWMVAQRRLRIAIRLWANPGRAAVQHAWGRNGSLRRAWETAAATIFISAPWPALLWFVGWLCSVSSVANRDDFIGALGMALHISAFVLLPLVLARNICGREGLAGSHFNWPKPALAALHRQLGWLIALGLPIIIPLAMLENQVNDAWKDSLGRTLFVVTQLLLSGFMFAMLRPRGGSLNRLMIIRANSWTEHLSYPTFLVMTLLPLALCALATSGYYYTALRLSGRLRATMWLVLSLAMLQALISRWLRAVYRHLAIQAAARVSQIPVTELAGPPAVAPNMLPGTTSAAVAAPEPEIDLEMVDAQTHRLLHTIAVLGLAVGLCLVWVDVLPALRYLDQIMLWNDANGGVSLADMLLAGVVGVLTLVSISNLPGLLEFVVLQRLPIDNGVRYALSAVTRYVIAIVGLTVGGGAIGIGWPKVQWLAAAVTFGLGFGLQEIFANFVSGLIVLFERPIRVGDTVTVGDVTGVVSRIRMRATTIVDGDRKELIVPNKEFITDKLVNWTLSDSVTRLVVRLGITYGSDTQQVQQLLLRVAAETPSVLKNPAPKPVFMGFSEKWMDFELRVFVGSVESLLYTRHQLNMAIDRIFREAGISLAQPQPAPAVRCDPPFAATIIEPAVQPMVPPQKSGIQKAA